VVVMGVPYIERCRCDHATLHRLLSMYLLGGAVDFGT
jgi:hypothetical protein